MSQNTLFLRKYYIFILKTLKTGISGLLDHLKNIFLQQNKFQLSLLTQKEFLSARTQYRSCYEICFADLSLSCICEYTRKGRKVNKTFSKDFLRKNCHLTMS